MDECPWFGHWLPICSAAHLHAGLRLGISQKLGSGLFPPLADHTSNHGFPRCCCAIQRLPGQAASFGGRYLLDPARFRILRLPGGPMDDERACGALGRIWILPELRRLAYDRHLDLSRHHHPIMVLPRPRRWRPHGRRVKKRFTRASISHDVGHDLQRLFRPDHDDNLLLLPRPQLATPT